MSGVRARVRAAWVRLPRLVRRGAVLLAAYNAYEYAQATDMLYKLSSPGRHALGATVLDLDLSTVELVAHDGARTGGPLATREQIAIPRVVAALRAARNDPRVSALVVRGVNGLGPAGLAEISELRRAIVDFSSGVGGKSSLLHVPDGVSSTPVLYFASAFDAAHVMPGAPVIAPGLSLASFFFKGTLDKLGVTPVKVARKEYKTAANSFTESEYTPPHRESTEALLDTFMNVLVDGISDGRGMSRDDVLAALDDGIMTASEAHTRGLIDVPAYRDELPMLMRVKLRDSVARRNAARHAADAEWREAFAALTEMWHGDDGREILRWAGGSIVHTAGTLEEALKYAVMFADRSGDEGRAGKVIDAELRALKAHLAWMETRPWEGIPRKERTSHGLLIGIGHIGSIIELEMRLCREAIAALEGYPADLEKVLQRAKAEQPVPISEVKNVIRWTRALWRGKTLAGRMVASITESPDPEKGESKKEDTDGDESDAGPKLSCAPRVFLTHQPGDPAIPLIDFESVVDSDQIVPKLKAGSSDEPTMSLVPASSDLVDYCSMWKNRGTFKDRLRYTRMGEYVELLSNELRACQRRGTPWVWNRSSSAETSLKGMPSGEFVGGVVNRSERIALAHLSDHATPFGQPWRMHPVQSSPTIAIIHLDGAITDDGSDDLRCAIRRANKDSRIHGIVLRIDSPGGSASASDLIARAVDICSKPVVASMGNVCASGGVYIASPCDKIFAEPATITGSIGVIMSAFLPIGLFESLGVTVDSLDRGRFSKYFGGAAAVQEWEPDFQKRIDALIDDMYKSFVSIASRGRGMAFDELEKIARGRVWSGFDAKKLGLIDEFGGLREATACAAELAGAEPGSKPRAVMYPSVSMVLENRLRRVGAMRSHLDEEGDEEVPSDKKRKRQSTWGMLSISDDIEADHDDDDDDSDVDESDETKKSNKDDSSVGDSEPDAKSMSSMLSKKKSSFKEGISSVCDDFIHRMSSSTLSLEDFRENMLSSCALFVLRRLDDYLLTADPSVRVVNAVEYAVRGMLRRTSLGCALESEMQNALSVGGRPAALMSPQVHTLDSVLADGTPVSMRSSPGRHQ